MGDGRFHSPKTIELEELYVERVVPKSVGVNTLNRLLLDMCQAAGMKRKTAYCLCVTCASSLLNVSLASKLIFDRIVYSITVSEEYHASLFQ